MSLFQRRARKCVSGFERKKNPTEFQVISVLCYGSLFRIFSLLLSSQFYTSPVLFCMDDFITRFSLNFLSGIVYWCFLNAVMLFQATIQ